MIPVLYTASSTSFDNLGLGALTASSSCFVTEERNGSYELEMDYPINGPHYSDIALRSIITAIPSPHRKPQPFRVYDISRPLNGIVKIKAHHISYDLSGIPVKPFKLDVTTPMAALETMATNSVVTNRFTAWSDVTDSASFENKEPNSFRSLLGNDDNSILTNFGDGEFEFDVYNIKYHAHRGTDKGCVLEYGKNITSLDYEIDNEDVITGIVPYWQGDEDDAGNASIIMLDSPVVRVKDAPDYDAIAISDFTSYFDAAPTQDELRQAAEEYLTTLDTNKINTNIKVSFVNLGGLDICDLCDTVTVRYIRLGVDVSAQITKIHTDVLKEQYESIEVGEPKTSLADTIAKADKEVAKIPTESTINSFATAIAKTIVGTDGGNYFEEFNDEANPTHPTGWCIMDTTDVLTARNCWRFTAGGLAHSSNGYYGDYSDVAITMDGRILANEVFLTDDEYLSAYIQASVHEGVATLSIGSNRNPYTLKLESDKVGIYQGSECLTYWTNNSFVLNKLKEFVIGGVKMVAQTNKSVSIINA